MNRDQITDKHRSLLALVYIRQSSPHQVVHHQESQLRQRNFVERAMELGWSKGQIHTVDEALGVSGSRSGNRFGFDQMVSMAALGKVGIILSLEVARLARGNRNWYHLLDVCGITGTLITDDEGFTTAVADRTSAAVAAARELERDSGGTLESKGFRTGCGFLVCPSASAVSIAIESEAFLPCL